MSFQDVFAAGGLFGVILVFFIAPAAYKVVTAFVEVWKKRQLVELDNTVLEINKKKLDSNQILKKAEWDRDTYKKQADDRALEVLSLNKQLNETNSLLETARADTRRAEGDLQQANNWSKDLVQGLIFKYERRISKYRSFIRPNGKVKKDASNDNASSTS